MQSSIEDQVRMRRAMPDLRLADVSRRVKLRGGLRSFHAVRDNRPLALDFLLRPTTMAQRQHQIPSS
jgi:hypothetical protein